ncbi:hypothetical protein UKMH10_6176 [Burkholderia pseudomallei]|uniref:Uncharacterized protein n=2 Tax=Burkholderia pseudomallei TaxID=28450 RepID=Q3JIT7_BURP1|nr:hypothetical protein BURPS1710b_A1359 [Burkholderia pseudomallei 1710b]AUL59146.1 hypothetical protein BHT10_25175 [Burkholderia pseudomallei]EET05751.1 conserved hypothetical protein [Burkholderia pseudomallei 1710a]PNX08740.1 hypothetical protein CF641_07730 [Burkholderia pseudomallei]PNX44005.1 hypothetical protein CF642_06295 [Burkholderia pseudomallei]
MSPGEAIRSDSERFGAVAVQCVRADLAGLVSLSGVISGLLVDRLDFATLRMSPSSPSRRFRR